VLQLTGCGAAVGLVTGPVITSGLPTIHPEIPCFCGCTIPNTAISPIA
jgi:hypothetical protein